MPHYEFWAMDADVFPALVRLALAPLDGDNVCRVV